ncbi:uncharacterized protein LOC113209747 isoform X2 [Frankliniella occidentalis]|nr:uncharacterized protein LOC113209747 isoform X2 [Frankliniella occidentalis]
MAGQAGAARSGSPPALPAPPVGPEVDKLRGEDVSAGGDILVPPVLSLPPEALAHVFAMLEPLEVVTASQAHPGWLEVANQLVLGPRGHLAVRLDEGSSVARPDTGDTTSADPAAASRTTRLHVHTLHLVGVVPRGVEGVRPALLDLAKTIPLDNVSVVWLHEEGVTDNDVVHRTEASQRATLDAILDLCSSVTSINFSNVRQSATYVRLIVDAGPRPSFRSRFVFTELNHHATSVLGALDELGAFFEETVVTVWRPQLSVTAFYPHYWESGCDLRLPYPSEVRKLCLYGSGLQATAYRSVGSMAALQELRLCDADGLGDEALLGLANRVRRLRRLAVHDAPAVSSEAWAAALRGPGLRHLESLEVAGCLQLDDDALGALQAVDALEELTAVALDLEGCAKASGAAVNALAIACPNVESLTLVVAFSPSLVDALERAPSLFPRLRRLAVRVQGSGWPGNPKEAIAGVDRLKRRLRAACPPTVHMDVSLTFVKLGMAVSSTPDHDH